MHFAVAKCTSCRSVSTCPLFRPAKKGSDSNCDSSGPFAAAAANRSLFAAQKVDGRNPASKAGVWRTYNDRVVLFIIEQEPVVIIIKNAPLAKAFQKNFEDAFARFPKEKKNAEEFS